MDPKLHAPVTMNYGKPGWAAGTTTTLTLGATTEYSINGLMFQKASAANQASPTTDANTGKAFTPVGVSQACMFVLGFDAAGAIKAMQGQIVNLDANNNIVGAPQYPPVPKDICPTGQVLVKVASNGAAWTCGLSNFAGPPTGVTFSFKDLATIPDRPMAS